MHNDHKRNPAVDFLRHRTSRAKKSGQTGSFKFASPASQMAWYLTMLTSLSMSRPLLLSSRTMVSPSSSPTPRGRGRAASSAAQRGTALRTRSPSGSLARRPLARVIVGLVSYDTCFEPSCLLLLSWIPRGWVGKVVEPLRRRGGVTRYRIAYKVGGGSLACRPRARVVSWTRFWI